MRAYIRNNLFEREFVLGGDGLFSLKQVVVVVIYLSPTITQYFTIIKDGLGKLSLKIGESSNSNFIC